MTTIRPSNYMPSNISISMDEIDISLPSTSVQHQKIYKQKESCDVILKFQDKQFFAHRFVLEKHSSIFYRGLVKKIGQKYAFNVQANGKKQLFEKILASIYGFNTVIRRCQIQQAYQICKSLQIQELLKLFHNDMLTRFQEYDIFPLLKLANQHYIMDIVQLCFDQLQMEQYQPIRYNKSGVLICQEQLFKIIIKRHNYHKQSSERYGLSTAQIKELIDEYCDIHGLKNQKKQNFFRDIEEKQHVKYYITQPQPIKKSSTPRKVKSSSQIFFRNTLSLPRDKRCQKNGSFQLTKVRNDQKSFDQFDIQSNKGDYSPHIPLTPTYKGKADSQDKSLSNYSTDNKSLNCRSRKQSFGSVESIVDLKLIATLSCISQSQKIVSESNSEMKKKAIEMSKKIQNQMKNSKIKKSKINKLQSWLLQIQAQVKSQQLRLSQIEKTLDKMEQQQHKKQAKKQFDSIFQSSVPLDLTVSTQFGQKIVKRAGKN